jgi:hypothetical protein
MVELMIESKGDIFDITQCSRHGCRGRVEPPLFTNMNLTKPFGIQRGKSAKRLI